MSKFAVYLVLLLGASAQATPTHLRTNALLTPLGIDTPGPTFSWLSDAKTPNWMQSSYELLIDTDVSNLRRGRASIWDSGKIDRSESVDIAYAGAALKSQRRYFWKVITWDDKGKRTASEPTWFETGMIDPAAWKARWITRTDPLTEKELSAIRWLWLPGADAMHVVSATPAHFWYEFNLDAVPRAASLHIMVRGSFTAHVNGQVTGHHDEWGAFDREEIRPLLHPGKNTVEVDMTSHGEDKPSERTHAAFAASLHITHADGTEDRLVSNNTWQVRSAPDAKWQPAQEVGSLSAPFALGADREQAIPGPDRVSTEASLLRKDFAVHSTVRSARLIITALGAYHAFLNHQSIAPNTLLAPGYTDFHKRLQYQTYDVTSMVTKGTNTLGVILGGGWYSSPLTWSGYRGNPGPELLRAQLEITFSNGPHQTIITDATWQTAPAPVTFSEIYGGESYDARLDQPGWNAPDFNASHWTQADTAISPDSSLILSAQPDLPINTVLKVQPITVSEANASHPAIFDMGQNMVGNVKIHLRGVRGTIVRMRYAERLNPNGSIYTENLRNADATDTYVFSGNGDESWSPQFTFHGFRYVELAFLDGAPATPPSLANIEGLVFNSLPPRPSIRLSSSSDTLNKMNELGAWGQRGNFVSIPSDCPQRDERLGWMGDAGVFWRTGSYNFDIDAFTHKFMLDVTDAQTSAGAFTNVSPNMLGPGPGAPGWGDAGVFIPYAVWLQYGDLTTVARSWGAMQRWMDFIVTNNPDFLRRKALGNNYGDWLAPDQNTPNDLIGTAYWALIAREMVEMANALHLPDDATKYQQQYDRIVAAYRAAYIKPDGSVTGNTQAAYLATIFTGIAPPNLVPNMVDRISKDIEAHGNHLTTGFLGTPFLMFVLDENGRSDLDFKLLLSDTYPSWGYMVKNGATTWWERWNGDKGDPSMNSYNHYAFGSVMAWVYRRAAGIDTDATGPGFHHLTIRPHFSPLLPKLHVEYESAYGTVISDWQQSLHRFMITIPANTKATIKLPGNRTESVGSGSYIYVVD